MCGVPNIESSQSHFPVTIRRVSEAVVSNPCQYLDALGFEEEFEFVKEGFCFLHPKDVMICVYLIKRLRERHRAESGVVVGAFGSCYLVEVLCVGSDVVEKVCLDNVRFVAKQLSAVVVLKGVTQKELFEERQRKESMKTK